MMKDEPVSVPVAYSIAGSSDHSGDYFAEHIMVDRPTDLASRWSGNPAGRLWILLETESLCVLKSITFGKFHKPHACNMKEFKIFIGLSQDHLIEVLHASLKADPVPETFSLPSTDSHGVAFPTRFVKIVALTAHRHNFNISIWYVALKGLVDPIFVQDVRRNHDKHRETAVMRHILKHLRQRRHITTYRQLLASTGVQLEDPLITELYETLVLRGDWAALDREIKRIAKAGLFEQWINSCTPRAVWQRIYGLDPDGNAPSKRGGHAMCIDEERRLIYLFGGWDGQQSLDDFWVYNIKEDRWRLISAHVVEEKNGPGPRACHKMVFDRKSGCIYVLGRLSDDDFPFANEPPTTALPNIADGEAPPTSEGVPERGTPAREIDLLPPIGYRGRRVVGITSASNLCSEFYRYRTRGLDQGKWELLNFDTGISGGPPLLYDHQLVIDSDAQMIYVHGGRVIDGEWESTKYSGLYSYDIRSSKWTTLPTPTPTNDAAIPPRFGHSMLLDPKSHKLHIFAGKQDDNYLSDMWEYDIASATTTRKFADFTAAGGPDACFAQRAVIDPELQEFYVSVRRPVDRCFAGLTKSRTQSVIAASSGSTVWLYRYGKQGKWMRVSSSQRGDNGYVDDDRARIPRARCAHQVVYDAFTKTVYMHGGNAGISAGRNDATRTSSDVSETRLDDFWSMTLKRPTTDEVMRRSILAVRCQQFREMCEDTEPVKALTFLRTQVSSVVDHSNHEETETFQSLLAHLLVPQSESPPLPIQSVSPVPSAAWPETPASEAGAHWTSEFPTGEDSQMSEADQSAEDDDDDGRLTNPVYERDDMTSSWKLIDADRNGESMSMTRFKQRTEVFEKVISFISPEAVQPPGNMLDMISTDYI